MFRHFSADLLSKYAMRWPGNQLLITHPWPTVISPSSPCQLQIFHHSRSSYSWRWKSQLCAIYINRLTGKSYKQSTLNTLKPRQNGHHFADNLFKGFFLNQNVWIAIKIPLKFLPKGTINNISALVQIMAWHHAGNKLLSEAMMVRLPTYICSTWPQWVNSLFPGRSGCNYNNIVFSLVLLIGNLYDNALW